MPAFFEGTCRLRIPAADRRAVFACLLDGVIFAERCVPQADGTVLLTLTRRNEKKLRTLAARRNVPVPLPEAEAGLPVLLARLGCRPGLCAGLCAGALWLLFSSLMVWRVDVVCLDNAHITRGADLVDTEDVRERLAEAGIAPGMFLPGFRARAAENRYLMGQEEVSFLALNRSGTVLSAEVRPARPRRTDASGALRPAPDGSFAGCSLVADADGQIIRTEIQNGTAAVLPEELVTKGQMLASGVFESQDGDVKFSRAAGKVFARTVRTFRAEIPLVQNRAVYAGKTTVRRYAVCFGLRIPLSLPPANVTFLEIFQKSKPNSGNADREYDIITDEMTVCLPDHTPLPLTFYKETGLRFQTVPHRISAEEARTQAEACLREQLLHYPDLKILSAEPHETQTDDLYAVSWDIFCIDNIAEPAEFTVRDRPAAPIP